MSKSTRLITSDFHFLDHNEREEYVEWLNNHQSHPALAKFIEETPLGSQVVFSADNEGRFFLKEGERTFEATLPVYRLTPDIDFFIDIGEGQPLTFTKKFWTEKKYNLWLQFKSDEDKVFPIECPDCGNLMYCSRTHYSKKAWKRVRCSDEFCGNVITTDDFVAMLKESNKKKLKESMGKWFGQIFDPSTTLGLQEEALEFEKLSGCRAKLMRDSHTKALLKQNEAGEWIPMTAKDRWPTLVPKRCRECGGITAPFRVIKSQDWSYLIYACEACYGDVREIACNNLTHVPAPTADQSVHP